MCASGRAGRQHTLCWCCGAGPGERMAGWRKRPSSGSRLPHCSCATAGQTALRLASRPRLVPPPLQLVGLLSERDARKQGATVQVRRSSCRLVASSLAQALSVFPSDRACAWPVGVRGRRGRDAPPLESPARRDGICTCADLMACKHPCFQRPILRCPRRGLRRPFSARHAMQGARCPPRGPRLPRMQEVMRPALAVGETDSLAAAANIMLQVGSAAGDAAQFPRCVHAALWRCDPSLPQGRPHGCPPLAACPLWPARATRHCMSRQVCPRWHPRHAVQKGLSRVPVVDSNGRVVGAVTKSALFWCLADYAEAVRPH